VTSVGYDPAAPGSGLERRGIRLGDVLFQGVAVAASVAATALLGLIAYQVVSDAWPAIQEFGLAFVWTEAWDPVQDSYGALTFVYGTVVTSLIALLLATPLSIAIALFLTEIAPRRVAAPIATLVELLAAIPSVVLGLWGILVSAPGSGTRSSRGCRASSGGAPSSRASRRWRGCFRPPSSSRS
jgi:phosphate transport system permease protein